MARIFGLIARTATLVAFYGLACVLAFGLFVAAIRVDLFGGVDILFYRGLADLAAVGLVLPLVLALPIRILRAARVLAARDAVAATLAAIGVNLAAFTLGPVTLDRSVSIFILSQFASTPAAITTEQMAARFVTTYVCDWKQIDRRLAEQVTSGNLEQTPSGYRLTAQGRAFMVTAQSMARLFRTDPRLVAIESPIRVAGEGVGIVLPAQPAIDGERRDFQCGRQGATK